MNRGLLGTFSSESEAISFAQGQEKSYILNQSNNSAVWFSPVKSTALRRIAGANRIETSIQISNIGWPNGAETVILASGRDFPDALSGAPLAYALDAPILLNTNRSLNERVKEEIRRLGARNVIILGGINAVSVASVRNFIDALPGSPYTALHRSPIILTDTNRLPIEVSDWVSEQRPNISSFTFFGGHTVISETVRQSFW
ncbi:hypothetical protein BTR23_04020 [Alkalihalophilus pseudofirmus]|nr:hypothetical protein BTR23_04020 [Alkalihalophilus pseudofirmus]